MRARPDILAVWSGLLAACKFSHELVPTTVDALPDAGVCESTLGECLGDTFRECVAAGMRAIDRPCSWGCRALPIAHCAQLEPFGGGVMPGEVNGEGLVDVALDPGITIDGQDGRIGTGTSPTLVRGAGQNVVNGIDYQQRPNNIAVFRFKSLTIRQNPTATDFALTLIGTRSIVLVADGDITVEGIVNAQGGCIPPNAGPGGSLGSPKNMVIAAARNGASTNASTGGGGGGGHFGTGGTGKGGQLGGNPFGDPEITLLVGGGGGGGGGSGNNAGNGGGGGGGIQLVANGMIHIKTLGGINAGGCGGETGVGGSDGGGGGGAGGTILLEAKTIVIDGKLAVNGGGGGGGDANPDNSEQPGERGSLAPRFAAGFPGPEAAGGNGGAGTSFNGEPGVASASGDGGGGGGAVGRIRINTRDGMVTFGAAAELSPPVMPSPAPTTTGKVRLR